MDGLGYPHASQQDAYWHGAAACVNAAATGNQGTVFQGPKRGRGWAQGANRDDSKRRRETDHPQAGVARYQQTAMDTCPAHAVQATAPEPTRAYVSPSNAIARLLSAANALLPKPANQQAAPQRDFDLSGPPPTTAQLALWAKEALQVLIQETGAATSDAQHGAVLTERTLRRLRGKARSAVSLWQDAIAAAGSEQGLSADEVLVPLAVQASEALQRVSAWAHTDRRSFEAKQPRSESSLAAEEACHALRERALAAAREWEQHQPTREQVWDLQQESCRVQGLARHAWGADSTQWPAFVGVATTTVARTMETWKAAQDARKRQSVAVEACIALKEAALTATAVWQHQPAASGDVATLQAQAEHAAFLVRAAWPGTRTQPLVVQEADAAMQQALHAMRAQESRLAAQ